MLEMSHSVGLWDDQSRVWQIDNHWLADVFSKLKSWDKLPQETSRITSQRIGCSRSRHGDVVVVMPEVSFFQSLFLRNYESVFRIDPPDVICNFRIDARFSFITTTFDWMSFQILLISYNLWVSELFWLLSYSPWGNPNQSEFSIDFTNEWTTRIALTGISSFLTATNHIICEPIFQIWIVFTFIRWMHRDCCHQNLTCVTLIKLFHSVGMAALVMQHDSSGLTNRQWRCLRDSKIVLPVSVFPVPETIRLPSSISKSCLGNATGITLPVISKGGFTIITVISLSLFLLLYLGCL